MFLFAIFFSTTIQTNAIELVSIPSGTIEAIWLAPVSRISKKSNVQSAAVWRSVKAFQVMPRAVTIEEFRVFLERNPKWNKGKISNLFADVGYLAQWTELIASTQNAKLPVTQVSWFAARAYCADIGMHLPSIDQWEFIAAASETRKNANRDPVFLRRILDWYGEPEGRLRKPVGSIYKNIYGVWDLHGLIWEWVEDFNSTFVTGESREDASLNKDMFCGAGAMSSADRENYAAYMRFAFRSSLKGRSSVWNLGFRCVR